MELLPFGNKLFIYFFFLVVEVFESLMQNFECFSCIIGSPGIHISELKKYITLRPKSVAKRKKKRRGEFIFIGNISPLPHLNLSTSIFEVL